MTSTTSPAPGARVLLIEDDPALTLAVRDYLAFAGFRVTTAVDAEADPDVDVIVSDYRLPKGATGTDAIASLRARAARDIPAIVLTGDIRGDAARDAGRMKMVKLVLKPVRMDVLAREIGALLNAR